MKQVFLVSSVFLTVLSLSSVIDGFVVWYSFFRDILDIYVIVRDRLIYVVFDWWLLQYIGWQIPEWLADRIVLWASCGTVVSIAVKKCDLKYELSVWQKFAAFMLAPFLIPILIVVGYFLKRNDGESGTSYFSMAMKARTSFDVKRLTDLITRNTIEVVGVLIVLLFINWQILEKVAF